MTSLVLQSLLSLVVGCFALYVLLEARSLRCRGNGAGHHGAATAIKPLPEAFLPSVSVLLPVYNEKFVVEKLINAACALHYPLDRLDILVLDDSSDDTRDIIAACVAQHRQRGIPIRHARRETRIGYKAGNLNFGLTLAVGDFIAIFDADCVPPPDFLQKTMPCFQDAQMGFLQTGVAYANKNKSFLTQFQAAEAEHKEDVTTGLSRDGLMASLTGSSCVWRRACIASIGGISDATITEDVDMGYRAQLQTWKYMFLSRVYSLAELPESMGVFRVQRQRWARGLVHNALRHVRHVFSAPMGLLPRVHALSLMFSSLLLAAFYVLVLIALPLAATDSDYGPLFHITCTVFLLAAAVWAWCNTVGRGAFGAAEGACEGLAGKAPARAGWGLLLVTVGKQVVGTLGYVLMFFPLSLYYFSAAIQVFSGRQGGFYCTPKGSGRKIQSHPKVNTWLVYGELFSLAYALATLGMSLAEEHYWISLYSGLAAAGFGMTLLFSWRDKVRAARPPLRHVLVTGSTGAIGCALALEYAAPGMRLTLHGRRADALEEVAKQCRAKGALVATRCLDLRDRKALHAWIGELREQDTPDLCIANAGLNTNIGPAGQGEPLQEVEALVEVNVLAVMTMVHALLPAMRRRGRGQIAIMGSLAGYFGLQTTPTYCATKAALKVYGEALRGWLAPEGIGVSVIMPGYVASSMCAAMPGPKPFLWTPQRAARVIRRGLAHNRARIAFPFLLSLGTWSLSVLPACLSIPIARLLGYGR